MAKDVDFRVMEDNPFFVQLQCLADWERVMGGGPWIFKGHPMLMPEYDGWADPNTIKLVRFPAWVHMLDLKEKLITGNIAKQLARKAWEVIRLDAFSVKGARKWGEGWCSY